MEAQTPALYFNPDDQSLSLQGDPLAAEPVHLKGLYQVLIELIDPDISSSERKRITSEVITRLHAHRSLCEDIEEVKILTTQKIKVQTEIEIDRVDDAGQLLQQVYEQLAEHISPVIPFLSLSQLLAQGRRIDEAFTGPLLQHGFINAEALAATALRRTALRTSDLLQVIMDVPGVRAVRYLRIAAGDTWQDWSLDLDLDTDREPKLAKLDVDGSDIQLVRNRLPVGLDTGSVRLNQQAETGISANDISPPSGRNRKVENYTSIQRQFPAAYGIGSVGLPQSVPLERKAQAGQLKAYLLFFDQLLANYFSQLAHMGDLFSCAGDGEATGGVSARTYFARAVHDPELNFAALYIKKTKEHQARLEQIAEKTYIKESENKNTEPDRKPKDFLRRNRFLNHLLARFAEQFTDYAMTMYQEAVGTEEAGAQERLIAASEKLIRDKSRFLRQYPQLSRDRGRAFNYLQPRSTDNISGLEQRLNAKLGMRNDDSDEYFLLVEHILLRPMQEDKQQQFPILTATTQDPYSLQLSFVFPNWPQRFQDDEFRSFVLRTVREETPAHLSIHTIHWLDQDAMQTFTAAYEDWLDKRSRYWRNKLGVNLPGE